VTVDMVPDNRP